MSTQQQAAPLLFELARLFWSGNQAHNCRNQNNGPSTDNSVNPELKNNTVNITINNYFGTRESSIGAPEADLEGPTRERRPTPGPSLHPNTTLDHEEAESRQRQQEPSTRSTESCPLCRLIAFQAKFLQNFPANWLPTFRASKK